MRRILFISLVAGVLVAVVPGAVRCAAATGGQEEEARSADQSLGAALERGEAAKASELLDASFEWTDADGKSRGKTEAIENLAALAKNDQGETDVAVHFYGELAVVFGFHHKARFARIWVKRVTGWRAFVFWDTPVPTQAAGGGAGRGMSGFAGDCDNPCRTLPITPVTESEKAVLAEWQKTKMDEWHPDAADWETHIAEEFYIINNHSERNKAERVAIARKQQEEGMGLPGDPVLTMSLHDFGETVVMLSKHYPYRGGRPYRNVRVFVHRNGHWLIAWSQQTTMQSEPAVAGAQSDR